MPLENDNWLVAQEEMPMNIDLFAPEKITCARCGLEATANEHNHKLCDACVKADNNRYSYLRQLNPNWTQTAEEAGLELWERQPEENDSEYLIWSAYRDLYPSAKPTYRKAADLINFSLFAVQKVGRRWHFEVRMQAWAKHVDQLTIANRQQQIVDMNAKHVKMAQTINEKLEKAINMIEPELLKPMEIVNLMKMTTELERKARMDITQVDRPQVDDNNPMLKKSSTKLDDMAEIVGILQQTGVLAAAMNVGIRKTETTVTEVVVQGSNDEDYDGEE